MNRSPLRLPIVPLLAGVLACSTGPADPGAREPGGPPAGAVTRDGIEYVADVTIMESFPVQLAARVTVTNRTGEPRTVVFADGCVVLMRAYRDGERVWDQAGELACTMATVPVNLAAGESERVGGASVSAYEILEGGLPDGEYRIGVYLRPVGDEVEIDAGPVDLAIPR